MNRNEPERTGSTKQNNPIKISYGNHLVVKPFEQRSTDLLVWGATGPNRSEIWKIFSVLVRSNLNFADLTGPGPNRSVRD